MAVIGILGFKGSGKGTIGDYLTTTHGYKVDSFANSLKDSVASIFGWDRDLLEGHTKESREWREQKDVWWSERLGYDVTPRNTLQRMGTEAIRSNFDDDIWVFSLEKRIQNSSGNVVITDCRFHNEIEMVRRLGGKIWLVKKGPDPEWWEHRKEFDSVYHPNLHISEWVWTSYDPDVIIENNGTLMDLYQKVEESLK